MIVASLILRFLFPVLALEMITGGEHFLGIIIVITLLNIATDLTLKLEYSRRLAGQNLLTETIYLPVVKQLHEDDPVLATAIWKKTHPEVVPPWHLNAANQGQGDE